MKKSAKLSLTLALMMGITGGVQLMDTNQASAEVSDKARIEFNGVISYVHDKDNLGGYAVKGADAKDYEPYWNNYYRIQFNYYQSKNIKFQARLHSDYDSLGTDYGKTTSGAYFDQSFLEIKDPAAKVNYTLGKKGAYLGQGLIHNSTGNLTGVQVSLGNWYDPTCLQLLYGQKKNGSTFKAVNFTHDIVKNWQFSTTYINHDYHKALARNLGRVLFSGGATDSNYNELHLLSVGSKVKAKAYTVQGEYVHNFSHNVSNNYAYKINNRYVVDDRKTSRNAWYIEVFTGPTSDMTSGLPLQKPGTNVWSLKYQDVGSNAVDSHNPTFVDNARGFRLNYGHTFVKGLSADIAIARMKDKCGNSYAEKPGHWKNYVMAEVSYKFR